MMILASIKVLLLSAFCAATATGCSYRNERDVKGSFLDGRSKLIGYLWTYPDYDVSGYFSIQDPPTHKCTGEFTEVMPRASSLGMFLAVMRYYEGNVVCQDGRKGRFTLESRDGESGKIVGQIDGRRFELEILRRSGRL